MKVLTNNQYYSQIANVIREQNGTNNTYKPAQMVSALKDLFYEEVEGVPPISFNGIGENLLDYRIDGASGGVGDRTNNLFDLKKTVSKKYINSNGNEATSLSPTPENILNHSDYVSIESNVNYTFTCTTSQNYNLENTIALCWFDENKNILSRNTMNVRGNINNYSITALSPSTAKYLIVNFIAYVDDAVFYLNEGTTTVFEPYGYKVPVVISGKNIYNNELYPLTEEQLIYGSNGTTAVNSNYSATLDYIPISEYAGQTIILNKRPGGANTGIAYYDENYVFISGTKNNKETAGTPMVSSVPSNAIYMRFTVPKNATEIQIELGENSSSYEPYHEPTTTNIYLDEPIGENESISLSDTNTDIPTIRGANVLTVDTTVQPDKVYVKSRHESSYEKAMREKYEEAKAELEEYKSQEETQSTNSTNSVQEVQALRMNNVIEENTEESEEN